MENEIGYPAWSIDGKTEGIFGTKPMLTIDEQIAKLESKGITFKRCSKTEATKLLAHNESYLHVTAYSKLFQRYENGQNAGKYVALDFADLINLNDLDEALRNVFRRLAQDVERMTKAKLLSSAIYAEGNNGYTIVRDFLEAMPTEYRTSVKQSLGRRSDAAADPYSGALIEHYKDAMPLWVFVEVISFGTLLALYLFCATRWNDKTMRQDHYALKFVKSIRNCTMHGVCIINGLVKGEASRFITPQMTSTWLRSHDIENNDTRKAKLRNGRIQQLVTTIAAFDTMGGGESFPQSLIDLRSFNQSLKNRSERYGTQNAFVSYLAFLARIIDAID